MHFYRFVGIQVPRFIWLLVILGLLALFPQGVLASPPKAPGNLRLQVSAPPTPTPTPQGLVVSAGSNITTNEGATVTFAGSVSGGTAPYTLFLELRRRHFIRRLTRRASPRPIRPLMATGTASMALPATM